MPRLAQEIRAFRPDILQTWLYHANLLGTLVSLTTGPRVVLWNIRSSDMDMSHYRRISGWVVRVCAWLSWLPEAVIVNSRAGLGYHESIGYRPRRWAVIPNGVDTDVFRPDAPARVALREELGLPPEAVLIGYVARLDPMKDHVTFLDAARLLSRTHSNAHFVLCGEGIEPGQKPLAQSLEDLGFSMRVHLLGRRDDIPQLTAGFDIATLASAFGEGFPTVVAEAMACGVPCVVTDVGDAAALVGDTGRVVPPGDPRALAAAWEDLLEAGPAVRERLGAAARRRIESEFTLPKMVSKYEELYLRLAQEARAKKHSQP
jgi:glycosyltransferase involved in cell wall biosynthesis